MRISFLIASLLGLCSQVHGKAVFAHFMLSNTEGWNEFQWWVQGLLASQYKLDGFAINIASGENLKQLTYAFRAAANYNTKLIFSFDYAGNGPWAKNDVIDLLNTWKDNAAYFKHEGTKPLVTTFEGPDSAGDWGEIKAATGCFFMPDWSSVGAKQAWALNDGQGGRAADGLFNWAAWPENGQMDTYVDASYLQFMGGEENGSNKLYMMPVSPWFYTNLPQYSKNWMWKSEDNWYDRWVQVLRLQPEYVQIISWNDFGESHYIGPEMDSPPMSHPDTPFNYVKGADHTGWLQTLPYWIDMYKTGSATITKETGVMWHTIHTGDQCNTANTTINTATHLQYETSADASGNFVMFDALLGSDADVEVSIGGATTPTAGWTAKPYGGVGVYHGKVFIGPRSGDVVLKIKRNGQEVLTVTGQNPINTGCSDGGYTNFNAFTAYEQSSAIISKKTPLSVKDMTCTKGYGAGDFNTICPITCALGYCPTGACVCTALGAWPTLPEATGDKGYTRGDPSYIGLCSFACNYGLCPSTVCSRVEMPIVEPSVSPFLPSTCTGGEGRFVGQDKLNDLCKFTCKYGNCPIAVCKCTSTGPLNDIHNEYQKKLGVKGVAVGRWANDVPVNNMCAFSCEFGQCPEGICEKTGGEDGSPKRDDYIPDPAWDEPDPVCDATYTSLEALAADAAEIDPLCAATYVLPILQSRLQAAADKYNAMLTDNYDKWFRTYASYVADQAPVALVDVMLNHGSRFFSCQIVEPIRCCTVCGFLNKDCRYCVSQDDTSNPHHDVCVFTGPYAAEQNVEYRLVSQPCPPDYSLRGEGKQTTGASIVWDPLMSRNSQAFYDQIFVDVGASPDDITWASAVKVGDRPSGCDLASGPPIGRANERELACSSTGVWFDAPVIKGMTADDIIDPKDLIEDAMSNAGGLVDNTPIMLWNSLLGQDLYDEGMIDDLVESVALPVFMLEDAVDYMQKVADLGKEIDAMWKALDLMNFLSALFMIIPMAGQLLGASGRAALQALGRAMLYAGEAGGLGLTIKGVVDDPSSAPWLIFNLIMSGKGIRDAEVNIKAANIARKMSGDDIKKFSVEAEKNIQHIRSVVKKDKIDRVCDFW